jgi:hypothetical protein
MNIAVLVLATHRGKGYRRWIVAGKHAIVATTSSRHHAGWNCVTIPSETKAGDLVPTGYDISRRKANALAAYNRLRNLEGV